MSSNVFTVIELMVGPVWIMDLNEYPANWIFSLLTAALDAAPYPSSQKRSSIRVLTTAQICRPVPFPWPMPMTGTAQFSVPAHIVELPYNVLMWCCRFWSIENIQINAGLGTLHLYMHCTTMWCTMQL